MIASSTMAHAASLTVYGYFWAKISVTGSLRWYELPKSP